MNLLGDREPVMVAAAIRAVIMCAVAFGLNWSGEQVAAVMLMVEAVLAVVTRQNTASPANVAEATGSTDVKSLKLIGK
jgi:hypothetical protein